MGSGNAIGASLANPLLAIGGGLQIAGLYSDYKAQKEQQKKLEELANQKPPVPTPPPTPSDTNPQQTAEARQRKLAAMRYGFASTISNMSPMNPTGLKTSLGQ